MLKSLRFFQPALFVSIGMIVVSDNSFSQGYVANYSGQSEDISGEDAFTSSFKGKIRVWRSSWLVDANGISNPAFAAVKISEHVIAKGGYEHLTLNWLQPFRPDLTPDVDYSRLTSQETITATGTNHGARATIFHAKGHSGEFAELMQACHDPLASFMGKEFSALLKDISWTAVGQVQGLGNDQQPPKSPGRSPESPLPEVSVAGKAQTSDWRWQRIEAHALCVDGVRAGAISPNAATIRVAAAQSLSYVPAALDIYSATDGERHPEWAGYSDVSYRVLEWQQPVLEVTSSGAQKYLLPQLVVCEEIVTRPKTPSKSYRRLHLMYVTIESNPDQVFVFNWENLLPQLKILDDDAGQLRVGGAAERDECEAWRFINGLDEEAREIQSLLAADLRKVYRHQFIPVASQVAHATDSIPIGASRHDGSFRLLEPASALQTEGGLGTFAPRKSSSEGETPAVLALIDDIRQSSSVKTNLAPRPRRRGFEPVTSEEQQRAKRKLRGLLLPLGLAGVVALGLIIVNRQRSKLLVGGSRALIFISACLVFAAPTKAQRLVASSYSATPRLYHVEEVREAIQLHCDLLADSFPGLKPETLWESLLKEHRLLRAKASLANAEDTSGDQRKLVDALHAANWHEAKGDAGPEAPSANSTLEAAMKGRGNCYARSLRSLLHFRLAGMSVRMLVIPDHVLLCTINRASQQSGSVVSAYDPTKQCWLSAKEIESITSLPHAVLTQRQIASVAAFNVGTSLCREGDRQHGISLLESAQELQFPFQDCLKNLCVAYASERRYEAVIEAVEINCGKWSLHYSNESPRSGVFEPEANYALLDTQKIYAVSLAYQGRLSEARDVAKGVLSDDPRETDFRLYRFYVTLKAAAQPADSSSVCSGIRLKPASSDWYDVLPDGYPN